MARRLDKRQVELIDAIGKLIASYESASGKRVMEISVRGTRTIRTNISKRDRQKSA